MTFEDKIRAVFAELVDPEAEFIHVIHLLNEVRDELLLQLKGDKEALPTEEISLKIVNYLRSRGLPVKR